MDNSVAITATALPLPLYGRGKVRDVYDLGVQLLIVATDRLSAFDVVLPTGIPRRGEVLTRLSAWWFAQMEGIVPNHLITVDPAAFPFDWEDWPAEQQAVLHGRAT